MILKHVMIKKEDNTCLLCGKGTKNRLHLKPAKNKTKKILDLGCGSEKYKTQAFFPDAKIIGIDFVKKKALIMFATLKKKDYHLNRTRLI